jgi:thiamine monophosphate synthase
MFRPMPTAPNTTPLPDEAPVPVGASFLDDILAAAKEAATYLGKGIIGKVADKADLPNAPSNVGKTIASAAVPLVLLGLVVFLVIGSAKK